MKLTNISIPLCFYVIFSLITLNLSSQTIVEKHGRLQVKGNTIVDKNNTPISLAGNSLFWSNAGDTSDFYNAETVAHLSNNWNSSIIRVAMGVKESWDSGRGYIDSPEAQKAKIRKVIDSAIDNGMYVIIDWHTHEAEKYEDEAVVFFKEMAALYGNYDNVIYEIYNEPIRQTWQEIKSYSTAVIAAIRSEDPDNLIVVGTPTWSQDVDLASQDPISDVNVAYTLHFYSGTHTQYLRDKAQTALNNGIALFVTEWGAVNATGDGDADVSETERWMDFLKENHISHANWSVSDKPEGASIVLKDKGVNGLQNDELTETGVFIKNLIKNWQNDSDTDPDPDTSNGKIECSTVDCILKAMKNAKPGDEIIIAEGIYIPREKDNTNGKASRFFSDKNGTQEKPIIIRAKNPNKPPILKAPEGSYDGYVMRILGDFWHVKDLIMEDGSKGLVFDNANNGIISNITVRDIGEEGIHLRDGSSNNLVINCNVSNTGVKKPGFGEGIYVGSDKSQHNNPYDPDCDNNTIENCVVGPNVAAECFDIKEGTTNTIIRNCTLSAKGITGENSADAFIDLKGTYTFVYNNTFNLDNSNVINAVIDFQDRKTGYKTGNRNAVFNNTFNLGNRANEIPSMRAKGGKPSEIHFWNNKRNPSGVDPISNFSLKAMVLSCPSWNIVPCEDNTNIAPVVTISSPTQNEIFSIEDQINVNVSAEDNDGSIENVELYLNGEKIDEDDSKPYEFSISDLSVGNYTITVKATDNEGASSEDKVSIEVKENDNTNEKPTVTITSPNTNSTFTEDTNIEVSVDAEDNDGNIENIELYVNGEKIDETNTKPYLFTISNLTADDYTISVKATDDKGAFSEDEITIKVTSEDNNNNCNFGTPLQNSLPSFNDVSFSYAHILGNNGPSLANLRRFRINWNAAQGRLRRFAINTDNGIPKYYVDLKKKMIYDLSSPNPYVIITNSGIDRLDGSYWVAIHQNNFVMVSRDKDFTIYFSNSATKPNCSQNEITSSSINTDIQPTVFPNPNKGNLLTIKNLTPGKNSISIINFDNQIFQKVEVENVNSTQIDTSSLKKGIYVVVIQNNGTKRTILLSKL